MRSSEVERSVCKALFALTADAPVESISISRLIQAAGISRSGFYYHFKNVESVFEKIAKNFCDQYWEVAIPWIIASTEPREDNIYPEVDNVVSFLQKNRELGAYLLRDSNYLSFRRIFLTTFRQFTEAHTVMLVDSNGKRSELRDRSVFEIMTFQTGTLFLTGMEIWFSRGCRDKTEHVAMYSSNYWNCRMTFDL